MNSKSIIKPLLLTAILSFASCWIPACFAQQTIHGIVTDAKTGQTLPGANIIQLHTRNGTSSDENGNFSLILVKDEPSAIRISYIGYATKIVRIADDEESLAIKLSPKVLMTNAIFVQGVRAGKSAPIAVQTMSRAQIKQKNMGQSFPYLLSHLPSVTTTSDAGSGIGYTSMHIRGIDPTRINITINGIPVNDAESQSVFWVDIPGLASSIQSIQVQRGVGTSTNGAGAFGASVNVQTVKLRDKAFGEINAGLGSFNTKRATVKLGSGLMKNGWQVQGRLSRLYSDGYRDRAFSNLRSFFLSAAHHSEHGLFRVDVFSGKEKTYQAWSGITKQRLRTDRTYNPLGTSRPGHPYKNQTDNYQQDHYQLHYSYQLSDDLSANAAVFFVYGRGYYQNYYANQALSDFGLKPVVLPDTTITRSDLINQDWLKNYFYGGIFSVHYRRNVWDLTIGGAYDQYHGKHYAKVVKTKISNFLGKSKRYTHNDAFKTDGNIYGKLNYFFTDALSGYLDLQVRHIYYRFLGKDQQPAPGGGFNIVDITQSVPLTFFNPKIGLVYRFGNHQRVYASFGVGNKEPGRDEYVESTSETRPSTETLYDWEAGYEARYQWFTGGVNLYYMDYRNQLVPTGEINDVGAVVLQNTPDSYRAGVEFHGKVRITPHLNWNANAAFSRNKIKNYTQYINILHNSEVIGQKTQTYKNTTIAFSPDFIGSSAFNFHTHGFTAAFTSKYVSRQYLDNTQAQSRSIAPYFVNDLRLAYNFGNLSAAKNINITLLVNNIFDEKYVSNGAAYGHVSGGELHYTSYYYPQAGRNFLGRVTIAF